jgi:hypothetical protein
MVVRVTGSASVSGVTKVYWCFGRACSSYRYWTYALSARGNRAVLSSEPTHRSVLFSRFCAWSIR